MDLAKRETTRLEQAPALDCFRRAALKEGISNALVGSEQHIEDMEDSLSKEVFQSQWRDINERFVDQATLADRECLLNGSSEETRLRRHLELLRRGIVSFRKAKTCPDKFEALIQARENLAILANPSEVGFFEEGRTPSQLRNIQQRFLGELDDMKQIQTFFDRTCLAKRPKQPPQPKPPQLPALTLRERQRVQILLDLDPSIPPEKAVELILRRRR
jgi:hypothetical protein